VQAFWKGQLDTLIVLFQGYSFYPRLQPPRIEGLATSEALDKRKLSFLVMMGLPEKYNEFKAAQGRHPEAEVLVFLSDAISVEGADEEPEENE